MIRKLYAAAMAAALIGMNLVPAWALNPDSVDITISGATMLGRTWRTMMRRLVLPSSFAASM